MMDQIDRMILGELIRDSRRTSEELARLLERKNIKISDRALRYRIQKLEKEEIITGYTVSVRPEAIGRTSTYLALIKTAHDLKAIRRYNDLANYFKESPFCILAAKTDGEFDWIAYYRFNSREEAELETVAIRLLFMGVIEEYRLIPLHVVKEAPAQPFEESEIERLKQIESKVTTSWLNK